MARQLTVIDATAPQAIHTQLHLQRARHHLTETLISLNQITVDHMPTASARVITEAYSTLLDQINLLISEVAR